MWKTGILCLAMLTTGCATAPATGYISAMPDEIKISNKTIDSAFEEWLTPFVRIDENRGNKAERKFETKYIPIDANQLNEKKQSFTDAVEITSKTLVTELRDYCIGHGGIQILAICTQNSWSVTCESGKNNRVNTPSLFGGGFTYRTGASLYFACRQGNELKLEVVVGHGTADLGKQIHKLFVRYDSPLQRAKYSALSESDLKEYHLLRNPAALDFISLRDLYDRFADKDDPENLLPRAKERRDEIVREREAANKAASLAKAKSEEIEAQKKKEEFLATVSKGSLVCQTLSASIDEPTGIQIMGQPQTVTRHGQATVSGYVNERANRKLQIQISGIVFRWLDESYRSHEQDLSTLRQPDGNSSFRVNGVIWDRESAWEYCR